MQPIICSMCGREISSGAAIEFDGRILYPNCLELHTVTCTCCEIRLWHDSNYGDSDTHLCEDCYYSHYTSCERCGRVIHNDEVCCVDDDDDRSYCQQCADEISRHETIHDYYYKPEPIFYGNTDCYFGVELEIDGAGEDSGNAETLLNLCNHSRELIYCKHDGSLDDGFEIVTHQMKLDFHLNEMPWDALCREAIHLGYYSHQASTCGLHIHVSCVTEPELIQYLKERRLYINEEIESEVEV